MRLNFSEDSPFENDNTSFIQPVQIPAAFSTRQVFTARNTAPSLHFPSHFILKDRFTVAATITGTNLGRRHFDFAE